MSLESLPLQVTRAVTVTVANEVVAKEARVVLLGAGHELHTADVPDLAILNPLGVVLQGEENTTAAPAELVSCNGLVLSQHGPIDGSYLPRGLFEPKRNGQRLHIQ